MKGKHLYKFGEYSLSVEDHALKRGDEIIPLTPKMFDLLMAFVRNPGKLLSKEILLETVWPDSFVEEGNVTFNIRQLRKALGDDSQAPTFIETVARRGYRFLPAVEEVTVGETVGAAAEVAPAPEPVRANPIKYIGAIAAVLVLVGVGIAVSWYLRSGIAGSADAILSAPFASEKLTTSGTAYAAAISPDGKLVAYSNRSGTKQGVWLRDLETGGNIPFIPPSDDYYFVFNFAPDGNAIYFSRAKQTIDTRIDIFRIAVKGGIPEKVVSTTEGWMGLSPDGTKISYVRCSRSEGDNCSLFIANARDGSDERQLVTRPKPLRIGDNQFSPDGKRIAFAAGQSRNSSNDFQLFEVDLESGVERELTSERYFNIKSLTWLPSGEGLLITASQVQNKYFRVWQVGARDGTAQPLTNDSEAYSVLSIDMSGRKLIATQIKNDFKLNSFDIDSKKATFLTDGTISSFGPDGRVYFGSPMSGNDEIWSMNADGSGPRQLTNDLTGDNGPIVSRDNTSVYFATNRSGEMHVWRMNTDGSNQVQITRKEGGAPVSESTDGRTLYYKHAITAHLWAVSLESGEERLVLEKPRGTFAIWPDGSQVVYSERTADGWALVSASLIDGRILGTIQLTKERPLLVAFAWMAGGSSIGYLMANSESKDIALYEQKFDGQPGRMVMSVGDEPLSETSSLAFSPDGKQFIVSQGEWKHDAVLLTGLK